MAHPAHLAGQVLARYNTTDARIRDTVDGRFGRSPVDVSTKQASSSTKAMASSTTRYRDHNEYGQTIRVEDERIQRLLRITDQEDCIIALMGASEQVGEKLFKNMRKGVSDYIKRRMRDLGRPLWLRRLVSVIKWRNIRYAWSGNKEGQGSGQAAARQEVQDRIMYMADNLEEVEAEIEQLNTSDNPRS